MRPVFNGISEETNIAATARAIKKYNKIGTKDHSVDELISALISVAFEYGRTDVNYVSTFGAVLTFYTDRAGCREVRFSVHPSILKD